MRILEGLVFWERLGVEAPTRDQVAGASGFAASGGTFKTYAGKLVSCGLATVPGVGSLRLTDDGRAAAPAADAALSARERVGKIIGAGHARILDALPRNGEPIARTDLALAAGFDASGGTFKTYIGRLISLGLVRNAGVGFVAAESWVWQ